MSFSPLSISHFLSFFFFNDTATTEIYTLSLHDALPIYTDFLGRLGGEEFMLLCPQTTADGAAALAERIRSRLAGEAFLINGTDRKSTRLNSSHANISYAVFCLKKKKTKK